jgi:hypothetical protein
MPLLRPTSLRLPLTRIHILVSPLRNMSTPSAPAQTEQQGWGSFLWTKLGYETLPQDVANKSFYDLRAPLPGKDRWLNMVSFLVLRA